jgi:hypothetical protein
MPLRRGLAHPHTHILCLPSRGSRGVQLRRLRLNTNAEATRSPRSTSNPSSPASPAPHSPAPVAGPGSFYASSPNPSQVRFLGDAESSLGDAKELAGCR